MTLRMSDPVLWINVTNWYLCSRSTVLGSMCLGTGPRFYLERFSSLLFVYFSSSCLKTCENSNTSHAWKLLWVHLDLAGLLNVLSWCSGFIQQGLTKTKQTFEILPGLAISNYRLTCTYPCAPLTRERVHGDCCSVTELTSRKIF